MNASLLWLLIRRQWRTNSLPLLALAVMIAVGSLSTVTLLTNRLEQAVMQQSNETLGADVIIKSNTAIPTAWETQAQKLHLRSSIATFFPTMVSYDNALQLAALKAVDSNYPLYPGLITQPLTKNIKSGSAWLDPILLNDLKAHVGDSIQIGTADFTIAGTISDEPDRAMQFLNFAPRVLISTTDLPATQLIQPGSNIDYQFLLAGAKPALDHFIEWVRPQLAMGQQIITLSDTQPQLNSIIERLGNYFSLVALFAVGLSGVAIAIVARHYTLQQYDICALFRCLGANQATYLYWQCGVLLAVGIIAAFAGSLLGYAVHYAVLHALSLWLIDLQHLPPPNLWLLSISCLQGIFILLAFALPPLLRLREVTPLRLLRKELTPASSNEYLSFGLAMVALVFLLIWQTQQIWLSMKLVGMILGAILLLIPLLYGTMKFIISLASRSKNTFQFVHVLSLRSQLGNASVQIIATTLVITLLILLQSLRTQLIDEWQTQLPADTPNQFLINILPTQIEPLSDVMKEYHLPAPVFYPIVAGRLIARNDKPLLLSDYPPNEAPNALKRALQLTWTTILPIDNTITAGTWLQANNPTPEISMDEDVAKQLDIKLNDQLTFMIGERKITAPVTSMRAIDWGSFQPNFFVIFTPGVLDTFPHTYITSFYLPASNTQLRQKIHTDFPNVALIDIGTVIKNAQTLLASASHAIEITLLFSLAAAMIVLITIFYTSFQQRYLTNTIMRSLGAQSKQLILAILTEYGILAVLSSLIAIVLVNLTWWWLATYVFHFTYQFHFLSTLYIILASLFIYGVMGLLGTYRLTRSSVQRLLSAELG